MSVRFTPGDSLCQFGVELLHLGQLGIWNIVKPKAHEYKQGVGFDTSPQELRFRNYDISSYNCTREGDSSDLVEEASFCLWSSRCCRSSEGHGHRVPAVAIGKNCYCVNACYCVVLLSVG